MFLKLRVVFTIASAICLGLALPLGAMLHYIWAVGMGIGALLFFLLMLVCKQEQELRKNADKNKTADFLSPENVTEEKREPSNEKK